MGRKIILDRNELYQKYITENLSQKKVADYFNVSIDIVTDINRCKTWKHLHNYQKNIRDEARCALKGADII